MLGKSRRLLQPQEQLDPVSQPAQEAKLPVQCHMIPMAAA